MTREEIENMPAGIEMNIRVIEDVMKWKKVKVSEMSYVYIHPKYGAVINWNPSTDISAAWEVVEKMDESFAFSLDNNYSTDPSEKWCANFGRSMTGQSDFVDESAQAPTAPLAICRAALLAVLKG